MILSFKTTYFMKKAINVLFSILLVVITYQSSAQSTQPLLSHDKNNNSYQIDYLIWEELLNKYVDDKGFVDYQGFVNDKNKLYKFTDHLSKNPPQKNWTENQKKAYFINAYNAYTIQLVVKHFPVESIKDIGGFLENVFKMNFIDFKGKMISLDDIEKGMLLTLGDPRVHFAVNCASFSCPKLDNKPYKPENLDQHLNQAATDFINSRLNNLSPKKATISKIFKWYKSDFETANSTLIDFINKYSNTKLNSDVQIEYLEYNWQLNSKENANNF